MSPNHLFGTCQKVQRNLQTINLIWNRALSQLNYFGVNPTYIAFSGKGNLYSVGAEEGKGGIASFTADFQPLNQCCWRGAPLCYVSVDDKRQLVYGANYHKGQVLVYQLEGRWAFVLCRSRHPPRKWSSRQSSKSTYPLMQTLHQISTWSRVT